MLNLQQELASICKDLRLLGDSELTKKAICAYAAVTDSENPQIDLSYSYIMRKLRKGKDDRRKKFQKTFKEVFDRSLSEDLDEPDSIALMAAIKAINFKEEE